MCMIDWRLGRLVRSTFLGDPTLGFTTIKPNPQRIALVVSMQPATATPPIAYVTLQNGVGGSVLYVEETRSPYVMTVQEFGDLITKGFTLVSATQTLTAPIHELTLPEEYLSAALDAFNSEYKPWLLK